MNRDERRKLDRDLARIKSVSEIPDLPDDSPLKRVYTVAYMQGVKEGFKDGNENGIEHTYKSCYSAAILSLRQNYRFGEERIIRFLRTMDDIIHQSLSSAELTAKIYDELGIKIDFGDGIEPFKKEDIFDD